MLGSDFHLFRSTTTSLLPARTMYLKADAKASVPLSLPPPPPAPFLPSLCPPDDDFFTRWTYYYLNRVIFAKTDGLFLARTVSLAFVFLTALPFEGKKS